VGLDLAMIHLNNPDPRIAALANAVFHASTFDIDTNNQGYRLRMLAAKKTNALAHAVRAWARHVAPIVADNRRRNEMLGENARIFPANEIPERVDHIYSVVTALDELAELLARQLYYPEMIPTSAGKPTEHVLIAITRALHVGGFSLGEIAGLTDNKAGDKIKRVRHRLGARSSPRSRAVVPMQSVDPIRPGRRRRVTPASARR
jgi:hypothetical protein